MAKLLAYLQVALEAPRPRLLIVRPKKFGIHIAGSMSQLGGLHPVIVDHLAAAAAWHNEKFSMSCMASTGGLTHLPRLIDVVLD